MHKFAFAGDVTNEERMEFFSPVQPPDGPPHLANAEGSSRAQIKILPVSLLMYFRGTSG